MKEACELLGKENGKYKRCELAGMNRKKYEYNKKKKKERKTDISGEIQKEG